MTNIHNFDAETGAYLSTAKARLDPLDRKPMVPANATLIAPPAQKEGMVRVFNGDAWAQVEDHRGKTYWLADKSEHVVENLGPMPAGALNEAPIPSLDERKEAAIAQAHDIAIGIRRTVAENAPIERAISWVNKVPYALMWKAHEDGGDANGPLASVAAEAQAGFQIEADVKGTTAIALRDRTLAKNATFFRATQLVEGMEGLAETDIPAAADDEALDAAIAQLQTLQAQAMQQLDAIIKGEN